MTMVDPPELWVFVLAHSVSFVVGTMLTGLSYRAYLRVHERTLLMAAVGFGLITLGGFVKLAYLMNIRRDYRLGSLERLALLSIETVLVAAGLVVSFWALSRY